MDFDIKSLKTFVKEDLRCECLDDVFNSIKYKKHYEFEQDHFIDHVFVIGERLLILVKLTNSLKKMKEIFEKVIKYGKTWRDEEGLNRFRLVIITNKHRQFENNFRGSFEELPNLDDKIHLHILNKKLLKNKKYIFLNSNKI